MTTTYHIPGRGEYCDRHHYLLDAFGVCGLCKLVNRQRGQRATDPAPEAYRGSDDQGPTGGTDRDRVAHEAWRQGPTLR